MCVYIFFLIFLSMIGYYKILNIVACCLVTKSCLTLLQSQDCSPPGSSVHGISQARIQEWVALSFSRGSSRPRDQTCVSCIGRWLLYHWATMETLCAPKVLLYCDLCLFWCPSPTLTLSSSRIRTVFFTLLPMVGAYALVQSRCSINVWWIKRNHDKEKVIWHI